MAAGAPPALHTQLLVPSGSANAAGTGCTPPSPDGETHPAMGFCCLHPLPNSAGGLRGVAALRVPRWLFPGCIPDAAVLAASWQAPERGADLFWGAAGGCAGAGAQPGSLHAETWCSLLHPVLRVTRQRRPHPFATGDVGDIWGFAPKLLLHCCTHPRALRRGGGSGCSPPSCTANLASPPWPDPRCPLASPSPTGQHIGLPSSGNIRHQLLRRKASAYPTALRREADTPREHCFIPSVRAWDGEKRRGAANDIQK